METKVKIFEFKKIDKGQYLISDKWGRIFGYLLLAEDSIGTILGWMYKPDNSNGDFVFDEHCLREIADFIEFLNVVEKWLWKIKKQF